MEEYIKETNIKDGSWKLHIVEVTYRKSFSMGAFLRRNTDLIIKRETTILFTATTPKMFEMEDNLQRKYKYYVECSEKITHNSVDDFFKYINYDVALNKKRINKNKK